MELTKENFDDFISRLKFHNQYWCWEFNAIISGLLDGKITFNG